MDYVPDTSVIADGRLTQFLARKNDARIILPEAVLAEIEHLADEGRSVGFTALDELKKLRRMANDGIIMLDFYGRRPHNWNIRDDDRVQLDDIVRNTALENDAILLTGDPIQRDLAEIKGIPVEYIESPEVKLRNIDDFFVEDTISVHLKAGMKPVIKKGTPGNVKVIRLKETISQSELESIAGDIVRRGKIEDKSFIELDMYGATVIQLKDTRIIITRPPFSDSLEITAIRPIVKLALRDYSPPEKLRERLESSAHGILVAGAPGAGKSTFVQALAEFYSDRGSIVKTMEKPRDLNVKREITQYTALEGSMEKTGDILLLVRTDYTIFDEMRLATDFRVFTDLRLAGVGMIGVVHATRPIDALQRFIGKIELGVIPQIIDTVIFIKNGKIDSVLSTKYSVKVPSGMSQEDLSRPVIEVIDLLTETPIYEIYSFGEQIVVVPVSRAEDNVTKLASQKLEEEISKRLGGVSVNVEIQGNSRAVVGIPEDLIPKLIGRGGSRISDLEEMFGLKISVEPVAGNAGKRYKAPIDVKNKILYINVGVPNRDVKIYVNNILVLQARTSARGQVRLRISTDTGSAIYSAYRSGKNIEYSVGD